MNMLIRIDGTRRRNHRLRDHLTAEDAIARGRRKRWKVELVGSTRRFEIEQP